MNNQGYQLLLVFVFSILCQYTQAKEILEQDKKVLLELYQSTSGDNWTTPWDLTAPISEWKGVRLENGRVVEINLVQQ